MNMMLTNNFYTYVKTILLTTESTWKSSLTSTSSNGTKIPLGIIMDINGTVKEKMVLGSGQYDYPHDAGISLNHWSNGEEGAPFNQYTFFRPGNGTKDLSLEDFNVEGDYILNTHYSAKWSTNGDAFINHNGKGQLDFTVTFTAIEDIFISEVGLFKTIATSLSNTTPSFTGFSSLFGRVLLDKTISLHPGESVTFQITIEL